jgi:hypothetical protein
MQKILDQVFLNGKIILHKNLDLTENCDPKLKLDPETFHNMIDELDKYAEYWDTCSAFVLEEQMQFAKKINNMAIKLGQHCYSYFAFKYGRYKQIIVFPAYHKTQVLGCAKDKGKPYKSGKTRWKAVEKPQRKKWAIEKALQILTSRHQDDIIKEMTKKIGRKKQKMDDLSDVIVQLQAFKVLCYVNKKL